MFWGVTGRAEQAILVDSSDECVIVANVIGGVFDTCGIQIDSDCDRNILSGNNIDTATTTPIVNNQPTTATVPKVGVDKLSDNSGVQYNAKANGMNDDRYNGTTIGGLNAGENITQWDLVYFDTTDAEYKQADADAAGEWPARGMAVAAGTDGNELVILVQGVIRNDGWAWLAASYGKTLYLDDATAGGITTNAPATGGDCVQPVGWVISDDEVYINISGNWTVVP